MAVLAFGAEKVRALELALGGKPPKKAADQSLAELKRHVSERFERRKVDRAAMHPLLKELRLRCSSSSKQIRRLPRTSKNAATSFSPGGRRGCAGSIRA